MLAPIYLYGLSDEIIDIYSELESEILQDMARRIARLGKITETTRWQAQVLVETGGLRKNISRILAKYDKAIVKQVKDTFIEALEKNTINDNRIFKIATDTINVYGIHNNNGADYVAGNAIVFLRDQYRRY